MGTITTEAPSLEPSDGGAYNASFAVPISVEGSCPTPKGEYDRGWISLVTNANPSRYGCASIAIVADVAYSWST